MTVCWTSGSSPVGRSFPTCRNLIGYLRDALDELLAVTTGKHVADRPVDHPAVPD
jgi:hypothetical protein